ncbi:M48 family metallopeptidase [soil metagenome]
MKRQGSGFNPRILIGLGLAAFSACSYFTLNQTNPVTGEKQHIDVTPEQEAQIGNQAAPEMASQYGGVDPDDRAQQAVNEVGQNVVAHSEAAKSPYKYHFTALADGKTINAFALPGGQVFVTHGLLSLLKSKDQLAGVLAHEIGHVVDRHGAEQMAQQKFTQGISSAAVLATVNPNDPRTYKDAAIVQAVNSLLSLKYSRNDESEADRFGVRFMKEAGYNPRAMVEVMQILEKSSGSGGPEFFQNHPNPKNRIKDIEAEIRKEGG